MYEPTIWSKEECVNDCCYFEAIQTFKAEPLQACPTCGHAVHRVITSFSVTSKSTVQENQPDPLQAAWQGSHKKDSPAARAARLAMRHICSQGCKH